MKPRGRHRAPFIGNGADDGAGNVALLSSHLLEEVEQVADHVTMISEGRIVLGARLADIKESHRVGDRVPSLDESFVSRRL